MFRIKTLVKLLMKLLVKPLVTMLFASFALSAMAEGREFPANAKRAELMVTKLGDMVIDGKLRETNPSTRIFNEEGFSVTTSNLDSVKTPILYTETEIGEIQRIWLLTKQEAILYKLKKR
ncbi:MAG: hypothetical protein NTY70_07660 [Burkholderiales bacterium]|jgi:hypothetical protein|nr:hypothetical protein [Burkholderiales bacterium]